jgi:hypothetical protein
MDMVGYSKRFNFDYNYWSHTLESPSFANQTQIFDDLGGFTVGNAIAGYNCSIFAYGQTGSGKTYTMLGATLADGGADLEACEELGLIPRMCEFLFDHVHQINGTQQDDERLRSPGPRAVANSADTVSSPGHRSPSPGHHSSPGHRSPSPLPAEAGDIIKAEVKVSYLGRCYHTYNFDARD